MPKIRLVLHDWNGCLLDDVPHRFEHGPCAIFRHFGLPLPTLEDYSHNISSDFMVWYYARGIPNSGDKKADGDMLNAIMRSNMATAEIPPLFPETKLFLDSLHELGVTQTLVSAMEENEFHRQLDHHHLRGHFAQVHGGIRGKAPIFRKLLGAFQVKPEEAIGVTDMMSDARELHEVGVKPIIVPRGYITPDPTSVPTLMVARDLHEALAYIVR